MKAGVCTAKKKDGSTYYRSSITYKSKHISLGSFKTEEKAHEAYLEAKKIIQDGTMILESFSTKKNVLEFKKWVSLINFRDNNMYIKTPIYLKKRFFYYYISPDSYYIFDVDDLFYFSTHSIMKRGGHLFVADYGMQCNVLSRYGIKNFAVAGRDYLFVNGDTKDFRYQNIEIINKYHGVRQKMYKGKIVYETKIHVNGDFLVGRYQDEITAAIAYNKAADTLLRKGVEKKFPGNFIENLQTNEYKTIFKTVKISNRISSYQENIEP